MAYALENAYLTLMGGFTTVQSVGNTTDGELRDAIKRGVLPGPRILTSLSAITDAQMTPDQIRERVRQFKKDGADLIKIFASGSIRDGGKQTLSDEQIQAACGEANAQGMRSLVHVYSVRHDQGRHPGRVHVHRARDVRRRRDAAAGGRARDATSTRTSAW